MIPGEINIQTLFAQLRLEQMLAYLPAGGWYDAEEGNADRIRFQRTNGDNGNAPFVLLLPRTSTAPQSRRLLQAAVYTLCDVEDRQPAEIIRDILAVQVATTPAKTSVSKAGEFRLRLSNDFSAPLVLQVADRPGGCLLMPGEAFEFVSQPPEGGSFGHPHYCHRQVEFSAVSGGGDSLSAMAAGLARWLRTGTLRCEFCRPGGSFFAAPANGASRITIHAREVRVKPIFPYSFVTTGRDERFIKRPHLRTSGDTEPQATKHIKSS